MNDRISLLRLYVCLIVAILAALSSCDHREKERGRVYFVDDDLTFFGAEAVIKGSLIIANDSGQSLNVTGFQSGCSCLLSDELPEKLNPGLNRIEVKIISKGAAKTAKSHLMIGIEGQRPIRALVTGVEVPQRGFVVRPEIAYMRRLDDGMYHGEVRLRGLRSDLAALTLERNSPAAFGETVTIGHPDFAEVVLKIQVASHKLADEIFLRDSDGKSHEIPLRGLPNQDREIESARVASLGRVEFGGVREFRIPKAVKENFRAGVCEHTKFLLRFSKSPNHSGEVRLVIKNRDSEGWVDEAVKVGGIGEIRILYLSARE